MITSVQFNTYLYRNIFSKFKEMTPTTIRQFINGNTFVLSTYGLVADYGKIKLNNISVSAPNTLHNCMDNVCEIVGVDPSNFNRIAIFTSKRKVLIISTNIGEII